ncbi:WXG100 family type VII secretion target [Pseudoflavonifractor sp. An187]|uniref:WXG100 family type VII secretion target n=1 Tax=Pseudoflavonifractor sp. An187 TaxID=1965578 RepID=UPI000B569F07|nr:WXG100 family type VII secretion target [Pseudoflavonifractor sp. An187]OUP41484.1 WXG100 family type VII secretion target [Pseudoflavonifractor sp. An187]
MSQIRMTPETMRTRAAQTDKQVETVQNVMTAMDNLLKTLKGEWEGAAVQGYEDRYNKIKPAFKTAKDLLEEIAHNLRATAQIVEETDKNIANQFRR